MPTRRKMVEATLYWFVRLARRAQSMTNGYFGGYIGKGQPASQMEIKKCIDKMHALHDRMHTEKRSIAQQRRSVTGRMVTDLEMYQTCTNTSDTSKPVRSLDPISAYNTLPSEGQGADTVDQRTKLVAATESTCAILWVATTALEPRP